METKRQMAGIVLLAGVLALSVVVYAGGSLEPSAPPGPIMKTLDEVEPRIPIHASDLPLTITEPNSYYLVEDVNFEPNDVNAITVECNSGTGCGIYMYGRSNVEVRNGTVRDFGWSGIWEAEEGGSGKGHRIIGVRAVSNGFSGIFCSGSGNLVKDCTAAKNRDGIYVRSGSTVIGNTAYNNSGSGIYASSYSLVDQNTTYNNGTNMVTGVGCQVGLNVAP
ncbi:MAG: right-handed parallel beta-helix repeat-containing protein [Planctomycetota bacterium]